MYTLYYHLNSIEVTVGEIVNGGDRIGTVGATGMVTGPHLHWELRIAGVAADPEGIIGTPILDKAEALLHIMR